MLFCELGGGVAGGQDQSKNESRSPGNVSYEVSVKLKAMVKGEVA